MALAVGHRSLARRADGPPPLGSLSAPYAGPAQQGPPVATLESRELWRINPDRSTLKFSVGQQILRGLRGQFHCWGGLLLLDKGDFGRSAMRLWVDLSSFDTGSMKQDERILATELFDVQMEPALVFDSELIQMTDPAHGVVMGRLAVHCVEREAVASIEARAPRRDENGVWHIVYDAQTSVTFGALGRRQTRGRGSWLTNLLWGEAVQLSAHIEAARETPARSAFRPRDQPRRWDGGFAHGS